MKLLRIIVLLTVLGSFTAFAQFTTKYKVSFGITTTQILGDNPAKSPMIAVSNEDDAITGGSFPDAQPGIEFRMTFPLDEKDIFRLPISIDYTFFRGKERLNYNRNIVDYFSHTLNVLGVNAGLHYVLFSIPFAKAKIYTGLEARMTYIHNIDVEWLRDYQNDLVFDDEIYKIPPKDDAVRLGGVFRFGVDGRLKDNFYINTGFGLSIQNLIGKNDNRGELLTPITMLEGKESNVYNLHVYLLIQYNL